MNVETYFNEPHPFSAARVRATVVHLIGKPEAVESAKQDHLDHGWQEFVSHTSIDKPDEQFVGVFKEEPLPNGAQFCEECRWPFRSEHITTSGACKWCEGWFDDLLND